jgi:hypothetical protein
VSKSGEPEQNVDLSELARRLAARRQIVRGQCAGCGEPFERIGHGKWCSKQCANRHPELGHPHAAGPRDLDKGKDLPRVLNPDDKDPGAVTLGRRGGLKGGPARGLALRALTTDDPE